MNYELIITGQEEITPALTLLDASELDRYQRLINPQKKLSFLTGQTVLKQVLANRLGISPASVSAALTPKGRSLFYPRSFVLPNTKFSFLQNCTKPRLKNR